MDYISNNTKEIDCFFSLVFLISKKFFVKSTKSNMGYKKITKEYLRMSKTIIIIRRNSFLDPNLCLNGLPFFLSKYILMYQIMKNTVTKQQIANIYWTIHELILLWSFDNELRQVAYLLQLLF